MDVVNTSEGWLWSDPLVLPLGVLWLNGTVDYTLLGFLTPRLVSKAPRGWSIGHMTPCLVCFLWWSLFELQDIRLPSRPLRTPFWPFCTLAPPLPGLIFSEDAILHTMPSCYFEEGIEGFYSILRVRWGITPSLQLTPAFRSERFAHFSSFWHLGEKYPR